VLGSLRWGRKLKGLHMPDIIPLGWFHTAVAIIALIAGYYSIAKYKVISLDETTGKIYVTATFLTAVTALMIFQHDGPGVAHGLAVLTLGGLLVGTVAAKTKLFGDLSKYIQALGYTVTLLFHMIPAITDALLRLPVGDPVLTSIEDPILKGFYLAFLVAFLVTITLQMRWLKKQ